MWLKSWKALEPPLEVVRHAYSVLRSQLPALKAHMPINLSGLVSTTRKYKSNQWGWGWMFIKLYPGGPFCFDVHSTCLLFSAELFIGYMSFSPVVQIQKRPIWTLWIWWRSCWEALMREITSSRLVMLICFFFLFLCYGYYYSIHLLNNTSDSYNLGFNLGKNMNTC